MGQELETNLHYVIMLLTGWVVSIDILLRNLLFVFISRMCLWNLTMNLKTKKPVRPVYYQFHLLEAHQNRENVYLFHQTRIISNIYGFLLIIFLRFCNRYHEVTDRHLSSSFCRFWHYYSTHTHTHTQIYRRRSHFILESASCAVVLSCERPYIRPEHKPTSWTVKNAEYNFWMPKNISPHLTVALRKVFSGFVEVEDTYPPLLLHLSSTVADSRSFVSLYSALPVQQLLFRAQYLMLWGLRQIFDLCSSF